MTNISQTCRMNNFGYVQPLLTTIPLISEPQKLEQELELEVVSVSIWVLECTNALYSVRRQRRHGVAPENQTSSPHIRSSPWIRAPSAHLSTEPLHHRLMMLSAVSTQNSPQCTCLILKCLCTFAIDDMPPLRVGFITVQFMCIQLFLNEYR